MTCRNFNHNGSCTTCTHCNINDECSFRSILVDANVILALPLQEPGLDRSQNLMNDHRRKYKLAVNHIILGEIFHRLSIERSAPENVIDWLKNNFERLSALEILEMPLEHEDFQEVLSMLKPCFCGERDKIIATCAIIKKIELATFDKNLIGDKLTINKKLNQNKKLKDKNYVLRITSF